MGIVSVRVVVLVLPSAPAPLIVTVNVPVAADWDAESVSVLEKVGLPLDGLNAQVTPEGRPVADSDTVLLYPFTASILIVVEPAEP